MKAPALFHHKSLLTLLVLLALDLTRCAPVPTEIPATPSATIVLPAATSTVPATETHIPTDTATPFVPKARCQVIGLSVAQI